MQPLKPRFTTSLNLLRIAAAVFVAALFSFSLFGCGTGTVQSTSTDSGGSGSGGSGSGGSGTTPVSGYTGTTFSGKVLAGTQPIANAVIQLYAAGTAGNGSAATALISTVLTTDAKGAFTTPGYQCPSASSLVYLTARGGNVGTGSQNSSIALAAPIGGCNSITASSQFVVNEATTVAAAWALAPFISSGGYIGVTSTNTQGLTNAFATAQSLVDPATGISPGATFPANGKSPAAKINTLANLLNGCVASATGNGCSQLFAATTVNSATPSNTLDAAINLVHTPGKNVATLFSLASASSAYQPILTSAPSDWTLFVTFSGAGMNAPTGISVDSTGNIWVANYFGVVSEFSPVGKSIFPNGITGYGLQHSYGIAIDSQNNIWIPNEDSPSGINSKLGTVTVLNSSGQPLSGSTGYSTGGLNYPVSIAVDTNGTSWVVDYGNSHVTLLNSSGQPLSGSTGYAPPIAPDSGFAFPVAVVVDANHNGWVANEGGDYITRVSSDGAHFANIHCCDSPQGLAIDQRGYIWASNYYSDSVSQISSADNTVISSGYQGGGLAHPVGVAIDGAGNVWIANFRGLTSTASPALSEFAGSASSSPGQALSPAVGWGADAGLLESYGIAIDPSGNVWLTNLGNNSVTEFVGLATPIKTPVIGIPQVP
jgi:hypothetical protein